MAVGDSIHVSDIDLGEGVEILVDAERTICNVAIPKVVTADEPEVEEELEEGVEAVEEAAADEGAGEEGGSGDSEG